MKNGMKLGGLLSVVVIGGVVYFLTQNKTLTTANDGVSNVQIGNTDKITGKTNVTDAQVMQTQTLRQAEQRAVADALSYTQNFPVNLSQPSPVPTNLQTNTLKFNQSTGNYDGMKVYSSGTVSVPSGYSSPSKQYEGASYNVTSYKVISSNDLRNVSDVYAKKLGLR